MNTLRGKLSRARNGRSILFCGAGFSADCLNFSVDAEIGTGAQLLGLLNSKLEIAGKTYGYRDLSNAADEFESAFGQYSMLELLRENYKIANVTQDMVDIVKFPWSRIYTTNYDNAIELACAKSPKQIEPRNNLDDARASNKRLDAVYLHGRAESWGIQSFEKSCVLSANSYLKIKDLNGWLKVFRTDIEKAEVVVFVGFNAADFHINNAIFDVTGLREKIFFINRPTASPDPDISATQKRFGTPLFVGRQGFAKSVNEVLEEKGGVEPTSSTFRRFLPPDPAGSVPKVSAIEDMLIYGTVDHSQIARDLSAGSSDYHVNRDVLDDYVNELTSGGCIMLLTGEICEGKTFAADQISFHLSKSRPVFKAGKIYDDLIDEFARISDHYDDAVFVIENCFDIRAERLLAIVRQCSASKCSLLLSSRNIAAEAEGQRLKELSGTVGFVRKEILPLSDDDIRKLVALSNQIAGWTGSGKSNELSKIKYIENDCNRNFAKFLIDLLESENVRARYKEEYNKSIFYAQNLRHAIIAALYISNVGHLPPVDFLSNALEFDVGGEIDRLQSSDAPLKIVHREGHVIRTVPSIGSKNILKHIVDDRDIVNVVVQILNYLSEQYERDDFENYVYRQMLRYSILQSVVESKSEINRFFDNISKNSYYQTQILFWLQWHMAKSDFKEFVDAEKFLERANEEADKADARNFTGKKFNRRQLEDRKAKFLMRRAEFTNRDQGSLYSDFFEATSIVSRLFNEPEPTHHVYESLNEIARVFSKIGSQLNDFQRQKTRTQIDSLIAQGKARIEKVAIGFQRSVAQRIISDLS